MNMLINKIGLFIAMLWTAFVASAYDIEVDGIYYNIDLDSITASITHGDVKYSGNITIPYEVSFKGKTFKVREIGEDAFRKCSGLAAVTIPNSVTSICSSAFGWCSRLTAVSIPNSVKSIGNFAFSHCTDLKTITLPSSLSEIKTALFSNCLDLRSITIPDSVKSLGDDCFESCSNLESVILPDALETIEQRAFLGCSKLSDIKLPKTVKVIGSDAFSRCKNLHKITLPDSLTTIGTSAFWGVSLDSLVLPHSMTKLKHESFRGLSVKYIFIPNSITKISGDPFHLLEESPKQLILEKGIKPITYSSYGNGMSGLYHNFSEPTSLPTPTDKLYLGRDYELQSTDGKYWSNFVHYYVQPDTLIVAIPSYDEHYWGFENKPKYAWKVLILDSNVKLFYPLNGLSRYDSLVEIRSYNPVPPKISSFSKSTYLNATLYVPAEGLEAYKAADVWKYFLDIRVDTSGSETIKVDLAEENTKNEPPVIYDLMGRRLCEPQKGLNIINGKKVFVR